MDEVTENALDVITRKTLYHNDWLSLMITTGPGAKGYVYSHETRCQGKIVALLPFRIVNDNNDLHNIEFEFLVRDEITPCWGYKSVLSSVTGGYEGGDIADDAVRELLEETGYSITTGDLIDLGTAYASKSSDTVYQLYSVDLTGDEPDEIFGDGSVLESEAEAVWIDDRTLMDIQDPHAHVIFNRLIYFFANNIPNFSYAMRTRGSNDIMYGR